MKKIITIAFLFFGFPFLVFSATKPITYNPATNKINNANNLGIVQVNNSGALTYPDKATFAQKNDLASTAKPYIYIDMMVDADADDVSVSNIRGFSPDRSTSTTRWIPYDVELKVVDNSTGQLVYWFSTTKGSYTQGSGNYLDHQKRDVNAKCFVLMRNENDGYVRPTWIRFDGTTYPYSSIYTFKNSLADTSALTGIGGIIIFSAREWAF